MMQELIFGVTVAILLGIGILIYQNAAVIQSILSFIFGAIVFGFVAFIIIGIVRYISSSWQEED